MIFLISIPFWLWLLLWIVTAPGRARARRAAIAVAAHTLELQTVAAMTEDMKAEYWIRKHDELNQPKPKEMSPAKATLLLVVGVVGLFIILANVSGWK